MNDASRPYHYWKFRNALDALAGGEGALRRRLSSALVSLAGLRDEDLPQPLQDTYRELMVRVSWKRDGDPQRGYWEETLTAMSDEDARRVADFFVLLLEQTLDPSVDRGE